MIGSFYWISNFRSQISDLKSSRSHPTNKITLCDHLISWIRSRNLRSEIQDLRSEIWKSTMNSD